MKSKNEPKQFPSLPPDATPYLSSLEVLANVMFDAAGDIDRVRHSAVFFLFLAQSPIDNEFGYFKIYQKMKDKCSECMEHYNHNIYKKGQEYGLKLINKEIGDLAPFFNQFQIVMWGVNERAKVDAAWHPLNTLLWGWFTALFNAKKHESFMNRFAQSLEECVREDSAENKAFLN